MSKAGCPYEDYQPEAGKKSECPGIKEQMGLLWEKIKEAKRYCDGFLEGYQDMEPLYRKNAWDQFLDGITGEREIFWKLQRILEAEGGI